MEKKALKVLKKVAPFVYLLGILAIWWLASIRVANSLFLPSPKETWNMICELYTTKAMFKHMGASFLRVTAGVFISAVIALPLGMGIAWCKPVDRIFRPIVDKLIYLPATVFNPLLVLMLGIGEKTKITFLTIACLFAYLPAVIHTCEEPMNKLRETAYTMGFSYSRMLIHVAIPYLMPSLLMSLITTYGVGWTYVIIAEVNNTQNGLGHLMYIGSARGHTDMVFAAIVLVVVLSFVFDKLCKFVMKKSFNWRFENEKKKASK